MIVARGASGFDFVALDKNQAALFIHGIERQIDEIGFAFDSQLFNELGDIGPIAGEISVNRLAIRNAGQRSDDFLLQVIHRKRAFGLLGKAQQLLLDRHSRALILSGNFGCIDDLSVLDEQVPTCLWKGEINVATEVFRF